MRFDSLAAAQEMGSMANPIPNALIEAMYIIKLHFSIICKPLRDGSQFDSNSLRAVSLLMEHYRHWVLWIDQNVLKLCSIEGMTEMMVKKIYLEVTERETAHS